MDARADNMFDPSRGLAGADPVQELFSPGQNEVPKRIANACGIQCRAL